MRWFTRTAGTRSVPSQNQRYAVWRWIPCRRAHSVEFTLQSHHGNLCTITINHQTANSRQPSVVEQQHVQSHPGQGGGQRPASSGRPVAVADQHRRACPTRPLGRLSAGVGRNEPGGEPGTVGGVEDHLLGPGEQRGGPGHGSWGGEVEQAALERLEEHDRGGQDGRHDQQEDPGSHGRAVP